MFSDSIAITFTFALSLSLSIPIQMSLSNTLSTGITWTGIIIFTSLICYAFSTALFTVADAMRKRPTASRMLLDAITFGVIGLHALILLMQNIHTILSKPLRFIFSQQNTRIKQTSIHQTSIINGTSDMDQLDVSAMIAARSELSSIRLIISMACHILTWFLLRRFTSTITTTTTTDSNSFDSRRHVKKSLSPVVAVALVCLITLVNHLVWFDWFILRQSGLAFMLGCYVLMEYLFNWSD